MRLSIKRNLIANYASQLYVMAIGVVMAPVYLSYMGQEAYGLIGFFIVMALVVSGVLGRVWLWPLIQWGRDLIVWMLTPLMSLIS